MNTRFLNWDALDKKHGLRTGDYDPNAVFKDVVKATNQFFNAVFDKSGMSKIGISAFHEQPDKQQKINAFGSSGNFPPSVLETIDKWHETWEGDDFWRDFFRTINMRNSRRPGMDVETVGSTLTFKATPEGNKAKLYNISGEKVTIRTDMYSGGLNWSRLLLDDQEYWTIEDNAIAFASKWWKDMSDTMYALIEAIPSSQNLAWQDPVPANLANSDPNYAAIRDFETLNRACYEILEDLKEKNVGAGINSQFRILAPLALKPRLDRMMGIYNAQLAGPGFTGSRYNVAPPRYSLQLEDKTKWYVAIPGVKNYFLDRMPLTVFGRFDELSYSDLAVGWGRYGGAIVDAQQWKRCAIS